MGQLILSLVSMGRNNASFFLCLALETSDVLFSAIRFVFCGQYRHHYHCHCHSRHYDYCKTVLYVTIAAKDMRGFMA